MQPPSPALGSGPAGGRPLTRSRGSGCPSPSALSRAERSAASTAQRARVSAGEEPPASEARAGDVRICTTRVEEGGAAMRGAAGRGGLRRDRRGLAEERRGVAGWERRDGARRRAGQSRAGMRCDAGRGGATGRGGQGKGAAERGGSARQGSGEAGWGAAAEREHAPPYSARADSAKSVWKNQTDSVLLFLCGSCGTVACSNVHGCHL